MRENSLTSPASSPFLTSSIMKCLTLWLGLFLGGSVSAADWPQFRGVQAGGVDASSPAAVRWDIEKNENIRWRTPVPGLAHASPILWGERVYIASAVQPGKAELKVGLYGDIEPVGAEGPQQW